MRFSVRHSTLYTYSAPVVLGAHVLRLHPRKSGVTILDENLRIEPAPVSRVLTSDCHGNRVTKTSFAGATEDLLIESRFELETAPAEPFFDKFPVLPWRPQDEIWKDFGGEAGPKVRGFAKEICAETGGDALAFLNALNTKLFSRTDRKIRYAGYAQSPEETLTTAKGACRDLSLLFMAAARSLGLPARFVSGYQAQAETPDGKRHLHAWPEVFLPGAGWRGYDPTHGCAVSEGHVALFAAADQRATMPVEGGFFGDGVSSQLTFGLEIIAE